MQQKRPPGSRDSSLLTTDNVNRNPTCPRGQAGAHRFNAPAAAFLEHAVGFREPKDRALIIRVC